jgi:uroporphyrinogen decarboxylase
MPHKTIPIGHESPLSPRERVALALEHREIDRIPIAMVCSGINPAAHRALAAWLKEHRQTTIEQYLDPLIDIQSVNPDYRGPARARATDIWGVRRMPISYGLGEYHEIDYYPLASATSIDDIAAHRWPQTSWFDYDAIPLQIAAMATKGDYCLMVANGNIFESSWYMRGFENIFMDLATQPEFAHALFERVTSFFIEHFTKILQAGKGRIDLVFTADDIGGQNGLLMSRPMWEEHLKPYHARLNRVIHEYGAKVIYHSDGAVMEAVDGLVDMGIDILQALQFDAAGMDPVALKSAYGDHLCFEGGISVQKTLPFGTPEQVRTEVRDRMRVLGKRGGYILGPSHAIQDGTPPENIVAIFDIAASPQEYAAAMRG